jgi:hypothetical protein
MYLGGRDIIFLEDDFGPGPFKVFQGSEPKVGVQILSVL